MEAVEIDFHKILAFPVDDKRCNQPVEDDLSYLEFPTISQVSQNLYQGSDEEGSGKDQGQDVTAVAMHKGFFCSVVCDGHGESGHLFALRVCNLLPKLILSGLERRKGTIEQKLSEDFLAGCFVDCNEVVTRPSDEELEGQHVRITEHSHMHKVCKVVRKATNGFIVDESFIESCERFVDSDCVEFIDYIGGCTCICVVIHIESKIGRIMNMGDSRCLVLQGNGAKLVDYSPIFNEYTYRPEEDMNNFHRAYLSKPHSLESSDERDRLAEEYEEGVDFEVIVSHHNKLYLRNPRSGDSIIEPTRGFGDLVFKDSGYLNIPQVSSLIRFSTGASIITGSDGVFESVRSENEFLELIVDAKRGKDLGDKKVFKKFCKEIYDESLDQAYNNKNENGRIDDMSVIITYIP
eukprot:maker-scaffold_16-snap-gene-3.14-mRNA-1 protein AED:0.01 eAED:0.01 QI:447/1/1/1/1/1/3/407/405